MNDTDFNKSAFRSVSVNTVSLSWGMSFRKQCHVFNLLQNSFTLMIYGFFIIFVIHSFWVKKALSGWRVMNYSSREYLKFTNLWLSLFGITKHHIKSTLSVRHLLKYEYIIEPVKSILFIQWQKEWTSQVQWCTHTSANVWQIMYF